jgi:cytoskeletal protein RodZ
MKTIGELLSSARREKDWSLQKLSDITRIDLKYLQALENNDFKSLPPSTFTKGFIRNIASVLGRNPDEMVAIFRRDYSYNHAPVAKGKHHPKLKISHVFTSQITVVAFGIIVFIVYLAFQYRAVITPPQLVITNPTANAVLVSPVTIEGNTPAGSTVTINEDLKITPDAKGSFSARLNLSPGQNEIKVSVTNRFSKTTTQTIPITILTP